MLSVLFSVPVVSGSIVLLALPSRWGVRLAALPVLLVAYVLTVAPPVHDPGLGSVLSLAIIALALAAWAVALAARTLLDLGRKRWSPSQGAAIERRFLQACDILLALAAGPLAALVAFRQAGWMLDGLASPLPLHAGAALAGVAVAALAWVGWLPATLRSLAGIAGLSFAALSVWGATGFPAAFRAAAESRAAGAPYCIALTESGREVRSAADFSFFGLDKSRGAAHHAVLLVDGPQGLEGYHWSYYFRGFREGLRTPTLDDAIPCAPRADFLATLGAGPAAPEMVGFTNRNGTLSLPASYRPRVFGAAIFLDAAAPDFRPVPSPDSKASAGIEPGNAAWLNHFVDDIAEAPPGPEAHGLMRADPAEGGRRIWYLPGEGGVPAAVIDCYDPRPEPIRCQHRFRRGEDMYSFQHSEALLPDWRAMEARLEGLFADLAGPAP